MSCELCLFHPDCDRWFRVFTESAWRAAPGSRTDEMPASCACTRLPMDFDYRQWGISPRPETEFMVRIVAPILLRCGVFGRKALAFPETVENKRCYRRVLSVFDVLAICANCASVVFGTTHVKGELRDAFGVLGHSLSCRVSRPQSRHSPSLRPESCRSRRAPLGALVLEKCARSQLCYRKTHETYQRGDEPLRLDCEIIQINPQITK